MQWLRVPLEKGHGKLSRWLSFPFLWSGLVAARLCPGRAPSGRGDTGSTGGTPGGRCHTVSASLSLTWFTLAVPCCRACQSLPSGLIHQRRQPNVFPYRERSVNRPLAGLDRSCRGRGLSSDKVGSKKKLETLRSSIVPNDLRLSFCKMDPLVHRHLLGGLIQLPVDACRLGKRNLGKNKIDGSLY